MKGQKALSRFGLTSFRILLLMQLAVTVGMIGPNRIPGMPDGLHGFGLKLALAAFALQICFHILILKDGQWYLPSLRFREARIVNAALLREHRTGKVELEHFAAMQSIRNRYSRISLPALIAGRLAECLLSVLLLAAASPVLLLAALWIKLDSRGPVFFRQERVGFGGRKFMLWKLRSMVSDAEHATGPVWAKEGDRRVTRAGRILRRTRIDELPQLFNVLRGEMSFIGPRPERPCFVLALSARVPQYGLRHIVKPGITGWAQVRNGYTNTVEGAIEKLRYDLYYIKNRSLRLNARIALETVKTCLSFSGV